LTGGMSCAAWPASKPIHTTNAAANEYLAKAGIDMQRSFV
jgi:hypothetical protein